MGLWDEWHGINVVEERNKGEKLKLIKLVRAKFLRGQSIEQIAEDLIEDKNAIEDICRVVGEHAPDYDVDKIYDELQELKKSSKSVEA